MSEFYQAGPSLSNTFESDPLLKKWVQSRFSTAQQTTVLPHLMDCGRKAVTDWLEASRDAEKHQPELVSFDPWGRRIDEIRLSQGWKFLEAEASREGILATAYERQFGALSRPYQMALLYLFHPSSAFVSCPLAMSDGAARCLEIYGTQELKETSFRRLISRDPKNFWTSGQWMTEKEGGSDVSGTASHAIAEKDGGFKIYGNKWFTSATTSQMSLLLARTDDISSLSMFYVEVRDGQGNLKNIEVHRLKDKMGTKALPTAELTMKGTPGIRLGEPGHGVKNITTLLNITRVYNSVCATAHMRRALDLLNSYSKVRWAFGKRLVDHPLHQNTLHSLEQAWRRCFALVFRVGELLGKEETQNMTIEEKAELRAMTPILKLYTAKESMHVTSEVCEGFGGAGYIEDTGIPVLVRDAQVFSIWEGTTNVLSLDFLRALRKEPGAMEWFQSRCEALLKLQGDLALRQQQQWLQHVLQIFQKDPQAIESHARDLAMAFGYLYGHQLAQELG